MNFPAAKLAYYFKHPIVIGCVGLAAGYLVNMAVVHTIMDFYHPETVAKSSFLKYATPLAVMSVIIGGVFSTNFGDFMRFITAYIVSAVLTGWLVVRGDILPSLMASFYAAPFFLGGMLIGFLGQLSAKLFVKYREGKLV